MITGMEHLGICSKDTARLKDWYIRVFGFKQVFDSGKGTYFLKAPDGSMIEFIKETEPGVIAAEKAGGLRHIALKTDDFDGMIEILKKEDIEFITDFSAAADVSANPRVFFFRDPDGNILHLISRLKPL